MLIATTLRFAAAAAVLASPASAFANLRPRSRPASATKLRAKGGPGYPLGAKTEGLLINNRFCVDALAKALPADVEMDEVGLLRFALAHPDNEREAEAALLDACDWRRTKGKDIVTRAREAVDAATAEGGWDNEVVRNAAPHASLINDYITPDAVITTSTEDGDLVYVIRASQINDKALMDNASVEQVCDFFLYAKEVHSLVANRRSTATGRMSSVLFANDIVGVRKPPDKRFSKALTSSSDQYESLYPSLAGPTLILNLPLILQAFVGLFKPLFPKAVQERLVFTRAPVLASLKDSIAPLGTDPTVKTNFVREVVSLLP